MSNDGTTAGDKAASEEPALTQKNSQTVTGETTLADAGTAESNVVETTSTRTKSSAVPTSYGAAGGTTDATEEGGDGTGI